MKMKTNPKDFIFMNSKETLPSKKEKKLLKLLNRTSIKSLFSLSRGDISPNSHKQKKKRQRPFSLYNFLFLNSYIPVSFAAISLCGTVFMNREAFFTSYTSLTNPLSRILVEGHLRVESLKWFGRQKHTREFDKGLKEIVELLERSPAQQEQLRRSGISLEKLISKIPEIIEFTEQLPAEEALYYRNITKAVLAVFSKHLPAALKTNDPSQIDWPRINLILKNIAAFDKQNPRSSLFKIKRAIEGRYSLKEFILCRV